MTLEELRKGGRVWAFESTAIEEAHCVRRLVGEEEEAVWELWLREGPPGPDATYSEWHFEESKPNTK